MKRVHQQLNLNFIAPEFLLRFNRNGSSGIVVNWFDLALHRARHATYSCCWSKEE